MPLQIFFTSVFISVFDVLFVGVIARFVLCLEDVNCGKRKIVWLYSGIWKFFEGKDRNRKDFSLSFIEKLVYWIKEFSA